MYQFIPRGELGSVLDTADFLEGDRAEIAYRHFVYGGHEAIYVEEDGVLIGVVSIGDLERYYAGQRERLEMNGSFSCTDKIDEEKAATFFESFRTFFEFPVVDRCGRLEGVMKREVRYDTRQDQIASLVVSKYVKEQWHRRELLRFLKETKARVVLYYADKRAITRALSDQKRAGFSEKEVWKGLSQSQWDLFLGEPDAVGQLKKEFGNFHTKLVKGVSEIVPMDGAFYRCVDGNRVTLDNPEEPQGRILFYGPCTVAGAYCRDGQTIESCLQRLLDAQTDLRLQVINRGLFNVTNYFSRMMTDALGGEDIAVVYVEKRWLTEEISQNCAYVGDLTGAFLRVPDLENCILDSPEHCNYKVNAYLAEQIYKDLAGRGLLETGGPCRGKKRIQGYYVGSEILSEALLDMERCGLLQEEAPGTKGAMALLADPFTDRHKKAVKAALQKVDRLYLFFCEDSNLDFSLNERMRMAKEALTEFGDRVTVLPAGKYLYAKKISRGIRKLRFCEEDMEYDCDLFGEIFGRFLGISHRFVMSERDNPVERKYMDICMAVLPGFGVTVEEVG